MTGQAQGPRALAATMPRLLQPSLRRRGFAQGEVLARWPIIVGELLAGQCCPEKLSFPTGAGSGATLQLRVAPGFAPQVQHLEPMLIERINTFYGYRAVARLRLVQGPLPKPRRHPAPTFRPLTPMEQAALDQLVDGTPDPALREALASLGRSLLGSGAAVAETPPVDSCG